MQTVVPCTDITGGQQVSRQVDHDDTLKWLPEVVALKWLP
eukprot:COSAG06_NODE_5292_length_3581_cov_226.792391_3_plen_40_part_00